MQILKLLKRINFKKVSYVRFECLSLSISCSQTEKKLTNYQEKVEPRKRISNYSAIIAQIFVKVTHSISLFNYLSTYLRVFLIYLSIDLYLYFSLFISLFLLSFSPSLSLSISIFLSLSSFLHIYIYIYVQREEWEKKKTGRHTRDK